VVRNRGDTQARFSHKEPGRFYLAANYANEDEFQQAFLPRIYAEQRRYHNSMQYDERFWKPSCGWKSSVFKKTSK
jgi:hypothetical protein